MGVLERPPRVCRVTPWFPRSTNPGEGLPYFATVELALPTLLVTIKRRGESLALPPWARLVETPGWDVVISGRKGLSLLLAFIAKSAGYVLFFVQSLPAIISWKPDIMHIHSPQPILHALFARYVLRIPLVFTFHGSDLLQVQRSRFWRRMSRIADRVTYVSSSMQQALASFIPEDRLVYTPVGVDLTIFYPGSLPRKHQVVMVGSLRWQKGYSYALAAFAGFRETHPDWSLVILGDGPDRSSIMQQIVDLGIDGYVHLWGVCPRVKVAEALQTSAMFMLSSVTEGFPKVVLEAMACGTPIAATDVGNCREIVEGAGLIVPPKDSSALETALARLADDTELWEACAQRGPLTAGAYSWSTVVQPLSVLYKELSAYTWMT